jgi:hypothetical protein
VTGLAGLAVVTAPENVGPGFAGFVAIFAIAVATVLLIRSMVGHLRKVRYSPGPDGDRPEGAPDRARKQPDVHDTAPPQDPPKG